MEPLNTSWKGSFSFLPQIPNIALRYFYTYHIIFLNVQYAVACVFLSLLYSLLLVLTIYIVTMLYKKGSHWVDDA